MKQQENILGTEKIGKLIRKFSIPCIISMVVNALYNIVDQIFVGNGVGYLGNGATNIIFPITVIAMSVALMIGDGTSAFLSLKLGEKKEKEAINGVGNSIIVGIIISVILTLIGLLFLPVLINVFGCTENIRPYALDYGYIIICGFPFFIMGTIFNGLIRADGSPKYAMFSMILGAVINTILDPILIFVFHMGVQGAAIATIFSQFINCTLNAVYMKRKFKSVKLNKTAFKLQANIIKKLLLLGISSFINQISIVVILTVENNMLKITGENSRFGPDIPITVLGIVMKINQILTSIIIGIAVGAQPILGYNYGAHKFDRVKLTEKYVLGISTLIGIISFGLFQTIPEKLIGIFGSGDELYIEFACIAFRRYLMLCMFFGIEFTSGIFFQAIGKSTKSAIISLLRQVLFLAPSMIILGNIWGIDGLLYAGPVADVIGTLLCSVLLIKELHNIGRADIQVEEYAQNDLPSTKLRDGKHIVITISREYGSGGRYIAKLLADKMGIKVYDKEIIDRVALKTGLSPEYIQNQEEKRISSDFINDNAITSDDELFVVESDVIKDIYKQESCVIVGRCADFVLKDKKDVIKVFVYNSLDNKIKRATQFFKLDIKDVEKRVKQINKQRSNYYKHYTGIEWGKMDNYDICINSDYLGIENSVNILYEVIDKKNI